MNWDQTGFNIVLASAWTMDKQGKRRVEIIGLKDKRQITAVICGNIQGDFLLIQLTFKENKLSLFIIVNYYRYSEYYQYYCSALFKTKLMLCKPIFIAHVRVKGLFEVILEYKNEAPQSQKWAWHMHNKIVETLSFKSQCR